MVNLDGLSFSDINANYRDLHKQKIILKTLEVPRGPQPHAKL